MGIIGVRRDGASLKRERIRAIHKMIQGTGDVHLSKILALCSYNYGLSRATARRYLRDLEALGFIEIDEDADLVKEIVQE